MDKNNSTPLILAIDTSCDETSAAVTLGRVVLSNVIASQTDIHEPYGGVFPTLAKRAHIENIKPVIKTALKRAGVKAEDIQAAAVTLGPGLAPALEIGIEHAQQFAEKRNLPVVGINHIEAHSLSVLASRNKRNFPTKKMVDLVKKKQAIPNKLRSQLTEANIITLNQDNNLFPVLSLVLSGGHSEFILINQIGDYQIMGQTIDDAVGEALDKVGRMLGLGYPAAPAMEKLAKKGKKNQFTFPLPMTTSNDFNLSYSGLKTSALRLIKKLKDQDQLSQTAVMDLAASFQYAVFRHITYKLDKLLAYLINEKEQVINQVWIGGGVSRNSQLRSVVRAALRNYDLKLKTPYSKRLCSDNAAMIGVTACFKLQTQEKPQLHGTELDRIPSWRIEQV